MVLRRFKHITFIVHFISIIFTSSAGLRSQGLHAQSCPTTLAGPWTVAPTPCIPCPLSPPALRTPSGSCLGLSGLQRLETCKVKILRKLPPAPVIHAQACHSHRQRVPTPGPGAVHSADSVIGVSSPQGKGSNAHNLPPQAAPPAPRGLAVTVLLDSA